VQPILALHAWLLVSTENAIFLAIFVGFCPILITEVGPEPIIQDPVSALNTEECMVKKLRAVKYARKARERLRLESGEGSK
jgi:hypothetical protein